MSLLLFFPGAPEGPTIVEADGVSAGAGTVLGTATNTEAVDGVSTGSAAVSGIGAGYALAVAASAGVALPTGLVALVLASDATSTTTGTTTAQIIND